MKKTMMGLICGCLWAGHALGAGEASMVESTTGLAAQDEWEFSVAPYFWAAGLSGKTAQFNLPVIDIDADFNDIFDNLDFGAMVMGEARRGRYSIFGDLMYTKIGADSATPRGILASTVDLDVETFAGLLGGGYAVVDDSAKRLDVVAGLRVWSVDTTVTFKGAYLDGAKRSDSATWVDVLAGVRGNYAFTPEFSVMGWSMVGAGGADLDWDVAIGLDYRFSRSVSATIGYRAVGVDYRSGGFEFDVVQRGPMAGLKIVF
ncbi:hypothetical protein [Bordetella genomosp. 13]|uniref:Outer membrane protein beta-barrel domain-containing protein n=1 Tax=Bordetella genomosp. 13 TaxID=463040 RepID=A0A1W6ZGT1_9BORD|nr:hypothetical protein [Bordetella genomosp. 13]ARP96024.1 hypothetical protein CAL15_17580 [Bordetella genomosp. 13]